MDGIDEPRLAGGTDERVLVFAPGRDGPLTCEVLSRSQLSCETPTTVDRLCRAIDEGSGVLVLAEEVLTRPVSDRVVECVSNQPRWSDLPVLVIGHPAGRVARAIGPLDVLGNVAVLQRPLSIDTLVTAVRTALRARRRQYQVRDLLREREDADRRKDEFLAMLAHELRNPLAPIRNAAGLLGFPTLDPATLLEVRDVLERQVGHMTRLIDDLLDVSRITRGKIELEKQVVDLGEAMNHAARAAAEVIQARRHELIQLLPPEPMRLEVDPTRLDQVLTNLLTNSAKYTPPGGKISLSAVCEAGHAVIRVRDDGIGVEPTLLPRMFDLFTQADRPLDRSQGGLGIGLTVVKSLVELHGGTVEARSDGPGTGLEMTVRLPALPGAPPVRSRPEAPQLAAAKPSRVLLVEDHADGAAMLSRLLRSYGHEVRVAHDGPSGIQAALEFLPDVLLLDIGLPGMDGYEVARRLRREPKLRRAYFAALTGYGGAGDAEAAEAAGFDRHLTKPVEVDTLRQILSDHGRQPMTSAGS